MTEKPLTLVAACNKKGEFYAEGGVGGESPTTLTKHSRKIKA